MWSVALGPCCCRAPGPGPGRPQDGGVGCGADGKMLALGAEGGVGGGASRRGRFGACCWMAVEGAEEAIDAADDAGERQQG